MAWTEGPLLVKLLLGLVVSGRLRFIKMVSKLCRKLTLCTEACAHEVKSTLAHAGKETPLWEQEKLLFKKSREDVLEGSRSSTLQSE